MSEAVPARASILRLARPDLLDAAGYEPIEPVEVLAQRLNIPPERVAKLDGNENPYGPSPGVYEALARYDGYHIYPDPLQRRLRQALAAYVGVGPEHIVAGSGSDELIELILRLFVAPGDGVIDCPPTFGMYSFCTEVVGGRLVTVPRRSDFSLDVEAIAVAARGGAKLVFLASPNNPSGNPVGAEELATLLDCGLVVVLDEAYAEFSGCSYVTRVPQHDNLIVLRTFSKWAGLAGLRVGYGVFAPPVAQALLKIKQPYNVNVAAQAAALASLEDLELLQSRVRAIVRERSRLQDVLAACPFLEPYPSQANFVLCRVIHGRAREIQERLARRGIFIRYFDTPLLRDYIRISVGKPEHTDRIAMALREIGGELGLGT